MNDKTAKEKEPVTGEVSDKDLENVAGGVTALQTAIAGLPTPASRTALQTSLAGKRAPRSPLQPGK